MIVRVRDPERGEEKASRAAGGAADDGDDEVAVGVRGQERLRREEQEREGDASHPRSMPRARVQSASEWPVRRSDPWAHSSISFPPQPRSFWSADSRRSRARPRRF